MAKNAGASSTEITGGKEKVPGLFIQSFEKSFRRCGRRFTREGVFVPNADLSEKEVKILKDEKALIVRELEDQPAQT